MSHLGGSAHAPAPSTISLTPSRRPIVRSSVRDHLSSPSSSVTSLVSSSSSSPTALAIEDLPLVLSILLEVDLRARASTSVSGLGEEGQAWVRKIAEMLDDSLELEADEDEGEDESERPLGKLKEALCVEVQISQGKSTALSSKSALACKASPRPFVLESWLTGDDSRSGDLASSRSTFFRAYPQPSARQPGD